MNWKITYNLSIITFILFVILTISLGIFSRIATAIVATLFITGFAFYCWYIFELNQVIKKKKQISKKIRTLEYVSYVVTILYVARFLLMAYSLFIFWNDAFLYQYQYEDEITYFFTTLLIEVSLTFSVVILSLNAYRLRKKIIGKYNFTVDLVIYDYNIEQLKNESYTTNEERMQLCTICTNRKLNSSTGTVCGLTNEKPTFHSFCMVFNLDEKEQQRKKAQIATKKKGFFGSWKGALVLALLGFVRAFVKGFDDPFGWVFLLLGILWLIVAMIDSAND